MWNVLKSLLGASNSEPASDRRGSNTRSILRYGKPIRPDAVFDAWTSGNLTSMLKVIDTPTNLIDRHFLLMGIVDQTYKRRKEPRMRELCKSTSELHIRDFDRISPALKKEMGGEMPRVSTFQNYATLLAEDKDYQGAILVCETALRFGLHDGTKSGFQGRISRIQKMASKRHS